MDNKIKALDSLPSLHQHLKASYSHPPSLPTLKRWAAAGQLKKAQVVRLSRRSSRSRDADTDDGAKSQPRYARQQAVEIISGIWALDGRRDTFSETAASKIASPSPSVGDSAPNAHIMQILQKLVDQVEKNSKTIETLTQSVTQLNGVRTALMNKYDSVNAHQTQIIEGLRQKAVTMDGVVSLSRDVQSVRIALSRLADGMRP